MNFDIRICNLEAMTLAFLYGSDEAQTNALLEEFLLDNNIVTARRFRMEMAVTQKGVKYVTYIKYAQIPEGTSKTKTVSVVSLPSAEYLYFQMSEAQYAKFNDNDGKADITDFMTENKLAYDMSKVFALVEEGINENGKFFDVYFPFKRK